MKEIIERLLLKRYKNDGIAESYSQAKSQVYILLFLNLIMSLLFFVINTPPTWFYCF